MPTLDTRPGGLDLLARPGNAVTLELTWPSALTGRTFTADVNGTALSVTVVGAVMTVVFSAAITTALTGRPVWKITETTSGTQVRISGRVLLTTSPTTAQTVSVTVVEDTNEVAVSVLGEPGPAGSAGSGATAEEIQDVVGAMVSANTETGIAVTYDDTAGKLDFVAEVTQAELDAEAASRAAGDAAAVQRANHTGTQASTTISDFAEAVQDVVGAMATDGTTVNFTYDDTAGTLTAEVQGLTSANLSDFAEAVRDRLGATLVAGTGITVTVDDPGDTVTIATTITQYTDEMAQDAIGAMVADTATIDVTYTDATPELKWDVKDGSITAAKVAADVATQAELDAAIAGLSGTYVALTDYEDLDVLNKIKNVDGAGSGLDADLLDGMSSAAFETPAGAQAKADAKVADAINNGETGVAPSQNAVFDALALKAVDADVVHDTGDETIAGVKTFSSAPVVPADVYDSSWNGLQEPAPKDAVWDAFGAISANGKSLITAADYAAMRTLLGVLSETTVLANLNQSSSVLDVMDRFGMWTNATISAGVATWVYFTPLTNMTMSKISFASGTTASTSATLIRFGLATVSGDDLTLVARTASDTTIFGSTSTVYERALDTTGGYPSTYSLVAGTRYAVGLIIVGGTPGTLRGSTVQSAAAALTPRITGSKSGETDLANVTVATTPGTVPWGRVAV